MLVYGNVSLISGVVLDIRLLMLLDRQSGIVHIALNEPGVCRILIQGSPQACFKCATRCG